MTICSQLGARLAVAARTRAAPLPPCTRPVHELLGLELGNFFGGCDRDYVPAGSR